MKIGIVGSGAMGSGIAQVLATVGNEVLLYDSNPLAVEKAGQNLEAQFQKLAEKGKMNFEEAEIYFDNIRLSDKLSELKDSELIIEAIVEDLEIKKDLFQKLESLVSEDCILATNTSSISITQIAAATKRPEKVIGMHFMNPVPIMKLVEIIKGYSTSKETFERIYEMSKSLGKVPVEVNDYPGFVANRILMPMINEAIETLYNGVAGVEEIDTVMKLGMAHPMGPLQLADFIGLDVCLAILNVMHDGFKNPKYAPNPLLVNMVMAGKKGVKSGEGFYDYSETKKAEKVAKMFLKN